MNPGRKLDALVAEKVMGLHLYRVENGPHQGTLMYGPPNERSSWFSLPYYSTNIAAAWEVMAKFPHALVPLSDGKWWCRSESGLGYSVGKQNRWFECLLNVANGSIAETAPHAICLAALEAIGYDISGQDPSQK